MSFSSARDLGVDAFYRCVGLGVIPSVPRRSGPASVRASVPRRSGRDSTFAYSSMIGSDTYRRAGLVMARIKVVRCGRTR
jgi:hypothetical protein